MSYSTSNCTLFTLDMYHTACEKKDDLASYSKHHIDNAFIDVPISDQVHDMFSTDLGLGQTYDLS